MTGHQHPWVPVALEDLHHPEHLAHRGRSTVPGAAVEVAPGLSIPSQSVLQQPLQQALLLGGPRATSILGYLSDSELQGPRLRSRSQELLEMDSFSSEDPRDTETSTSASTSDVGFLSMSVGPTACVEEETREKPPPLGLLSGLAHPAGGVLVEQPGWRDLGRERLALLQDAPIHSPMVPRSRKGQEDGDVGDRVEGPVQEVLDLLRSADPAQPQLRELEYQVLGLRERLKVCPLRAHTGQQGRFAASLRLGSRCGNQPAQVSIPASPLCDLGGPSLPHAQFPHFSRPRRRIPRGGRSAQ